MSLEHFAYPEEKQRKWKAGNNMMSFECFLTVFFPKQKATYT